MSIKLNGKTVKAFIFCVVWGIAYNLILANKHQEQLKEVETPLVRIFLSGTYEVINKVIKRYTLHLVTIEVTTPQSHD